MLPFLLTAVECIYVLWLAQVTEKANTVFVYGIHSMVLRPVHREHTVCFDIITSCVCKMYIIHGRQYMLQSANISTYFPSFFSTSNTLITLNILIVLNNWENGVTANIHYDDVRMGAIASQITSLAIVYSAFYSGVDQRKHQSSASLAFVWGIHRDRWIPRTKGQLRGKCFHLMTSSCWISNSFLWPATRMSTRLCTIWPCDLPFNLFQQTSMT